MIYILLAVLCSTGVSQILKITDRRRMNVEPIFLINYAAAATAAFFQGDRTTLPSPAESLGPVFYIVAFFLGLVFIGAFYIYRKTISLMGISLSATISRLSAGVPLLGSMIFFRETPLPRQAAGMILMFIAIPLASDRSKDPHRRGSTVWGVLLFLAFGINDFTLKVVRELWPRTDEGSFLFFVFLTSFLTALVLLVWKREKIRPGLILPGVILGLINLGSSYFILKSLQSLDAIVVYPVLALGIIVLGLVTGILFWKERLTPAHALFILIASGAVLLIS